MKKNEIKYDKLVRDRIPEIIKQNQKQCKVHIADTDEYRDRLYNKLQEEVSEFLQEPCAEEIADILEVIDAIIHVNSYNNVQMIKDNKAKKRGKFEQKVVLESVWEE